MTAPQQFTWSAEFSVMVPLRRTLADRVYTDGEVYRLAVEEERSMKSHRHYMAMISETHSNLSDPDAERWQTPDHLRRYCLIKCGYFDERSVVCASKADAQRVAAFIKPMDSYAVVTVSECTVRVYTAKSQSVKAMGAKEFQASKQKVLDYIASLIGVTPKALAENVGRAA